MERFSSYIFDGFRVLTWRLPFVPVSEFEELSLKVKQMENQVLGLGQELLGMSAFLLFTCQRIILAYYLHYDDDEV